MSPTRRPRGRATGTATGTATKTTSISKIRTDAFPRSEGGQTMGYMRDNPGGGYGSRPPGGGGSGGGRPTGPRAGGRKRFLFRRRKYCKFCEDKARWVD